VTRTRRRLLLDGLTAILAAGGVTLIAVGGAAPAPPTRAVAAAVPQSVIGPPAPSPSASRPAAPSPADAPAPSAARTAPVPVHLNIAAIQVDTALTQVGLNPDGTIQVPPLTKGAPAGWYRNLAIPGDVGTSVILGHVDTARDGPAVFYRLQELKPGDEISVGRADGTTAVFTVSQVTQYPKADFPTAQVYGAVAYPALRLITCGGSFDALRHTYRGNVVVFAALKMMIR
jgi:hypothetical protein